MGDERPLRAGRPDPAAVRRSADGATWSGFLETMPAAFCFLDTHWRFRYVNAEAERLLAAAAPTSSASRCGTAFPGLTGSVDRADATASAVATGRPDDLRDRRTAARPRQWFEVRVWPGPDGLALYVLDVTDRRGRRGGRPPRRRRAPRCSAQVSAELAGELDTESALARLAQLVVPVLTDGCIVTVVDREGRARDVGSWHADPARRPLMAAVHPRPAGHPAQRLPGRPGAATPARRSTESVDAVLELMPPGPGPRPAGRPRPGDGGGAAADRGGPHGRRPHPLPGRRPQPQRRGPGDRPPGRRRGRPGRRAGAPAEPAGPARRGAPAQPAHRSAASWATPQSSCATSRPRRRPASGGDWYDAFPQRDGAPVVVIGDVVGHDTAAAAAMGQLRGLLRGIAHYSGAGPAEVLRGLDEAIADMHTDTLATAAVARLERRRRRRRAGGRLRWANAGPPAADPDRARTARSRCSAARSATCARGGPHGRARGVGRRRSPPGTTVLLYTDGLVERRGSTIDEGIDRLVDQLGELAGPPLDELCDALLDGCCRGTPQDDVAIVAVSARRPRPWGMR